MLHDLADWKFFQPTRTRLASHATFSAHASFTRPTTRRTPCSSVPQAEKRELESANEELQAALDAVRDEARALHSRATVAEESREAASQTLLNLTQRAAVLEAEKQVGPGSRGLGEWVLAWCPVQIF